MNARNAIFLPRLPRNLVAPLLLTTAMLGAEAPAQQSSPLQQSNPAPQWRLAQPANSPSPREGASMVYDTARQRTVLFGGYEWVADVHFQETWEYAGSTWSNRNLSHAPAPRQRAGMCYDAARGVTVLFGGIDNGGLWGNPTYFNDTWEFDGASWRRISVPGNVPSPRFAELTYDSARGVVVLFGGTGSTSPYEFRDTWEYDGASWTLRSTAVSPTAENTYETAYDPIRGKTVLIAGHIYGRQIPTQTWEWDGMTWAAASPQPIPPVFPEPQLIFDPSRSKLLLLGSGYASDAETWEWDGAQWIRDHAAALPRNSLTGHAMVYDSARGVAVAFGGEFTSGMWINSSNETWELALDANVTAFGSSCAAQGAAAALASQPGTAPRTGTTYVAEITQLGSSDVPFVLFGNSNQNLSGVPLPFDLSLIGLPGCALLTSTEFAFPLTNVTGTAAWSLAIPADASLNGTQVYVQGLVLDAGLTPRGATHGLALTIGS